LVRGFRCCGNIAPNAKRQRVLVVAPCPVDIFCSGDWTRVLLVPEQPTNLQGEATSPTSIQLTWDEPRERDGRAALTVDSYELYYNDSHLRQNVRVTISPPVNSYRLDDLTPDTVYHIRVSARSAARGESASTPTIQVRTPDYGPSRRRINCLL